MIRICIVSDDLSLRNNIAMASNEEFDVCTTILHEPTGEKITNHLKTCGPDILLLDASLIAQNNNMVEDIIRDWPVPILLLGKKGVYTQDILRALKVGAVDILHLPDKQEDLLTNDIFLRIKTIALARLQHFKKPTVVQMKSTIPRNKIIVIAASTGGPPTIESILSSLPKNISVPILIVQHMPTGFTTTFASRLNELCNIEVCEAHEGQLLEPGIAYIAPGGKHMIVQPRSDNHHAIHLTDGAPQFGLRPCANTLFESVAPLFKEHTIGVVLTGMGRDGTIGAAVIKSHGGTIIVEAEESCVVFGMPKEIIDGGYADVVALLEQLPAILLQKIEE